MKSMTGYAKNHCIIGGKKITIEIKTLNSKQIDINTKLPAPYRDKELTIRSLLMQLDRGKIDCIITEENTAEAEAGLNTMLIRTRYEALRQLLGEMNILANKEILINSILAQSDVWNAVNSDEASEAEWLELEKCIVSTIADCDTFRTHEGNVLKEDLARHVSVIEQKLIQIPKYENERIEAVKEHLRKELVELAHDKADENRFEQEMIYYLEKLDITEEKIRLAKHISYFRNTMDSENANGKKLNFIAQEMGREINTTGSKANHVEIQRLVVEMKDELEKIKEQLANIL